jgi:hypothetical protein
MIKSARKQCLVHRNGRARRRFDERSFDFGSGRGTAGVHDACVAVPSLARELQRTVGIAVELGAQRDELPDSCRPVVDEDSHRVFIAQARAGVQCVGEMLIDRVGGDLAQDRGNAALRPSGGGLSDGALRDDADTQTRRGGADCRS